MKATSKYLLMLDKVFINKSAIAAIIMVRLTSGGVLEFMLYRALIDCLSV